MRAAPASAPYRPPAGGRRLPGVLAASGDDGSGYGRGRADSGVGDLCPGRVRSVRGVVDSSFIRGDEVLFSEVSPRPHDTGLVTLISLNLSEFALHTRATGALYPPTGSFCVGGDTAGRELDPDPLRQPGRARYRTEPIRQAGDPGPPPHGRVSRAENIDAARDKARCSAATVKF